MKTAIVTFSDGDTITTDINGTDGQIREYYKIGKVFNLGGIYDPAQDRLVKVVSVEIKQEVKV